MRVLHLSTYDVKGGAAKAAYRLHHALRTIDVDSQMLVRQKSQIDETVHRPPNGLPHLDMILSQRMEVWLKQAFQVPESFDLGWWPNQIAEYIKNFEADILHLHWVSGGYFPIQALRKISIPIVWTLHDMAAFTGGCHYSEGCEAYKQTCGNCPLLSHPKPNDISRQTWSNKAQAWKNLKLRIVSPSNWLAKAASESSLFANQDIQVIHNGINLEIFQPKSINEITERLAIPKDKAIILFGAFNSLGDKRKGIVYLLEALKYLSIDWAEKAVCLIFGAETPSVPLDLDLPIYYTGFISKEEEMAALYAKADVFVAPSLEDNLPNTVVEALACGTPVVAFDTTGLPSMIEHQVNGYLAKAFEAEDLARGIDWVLKDKEYLQRLSTQARETAVKKFDERKMAEAYLSLYQEILSVSHSLF